MADNNSITGSLVGKIRFNIDKKSWDNLDLFQKKMTSIKRQMSSFDKTIKVQAVVQGINKVANATVQAEQKIAKVKVESAKKVAKATGGVGLEFGKATGNNREYASWWKDALAERDRATKAAAKAEATRQAQAARIAREDAKFKARGSKYDEGVEAFRVVKEQQLRSTAKMRGWSDSQREDAERALAKSIEHWRGAANGSIGMFRAQVNTVMRDLQVTDAVARKSALTFRGLRQELVQLTAAYTAFSLAQNVAQTGFEFESLRASARVFAKDDAGVADHMAFIANEAQRLGIDLATATKEFTKFSIATQSSMTKAEQRDLFTGMSEYSRVLGLNKQDYERAFRAVQQIECCLPI